MFQLLIIISKKQFWHYMDFIQEDIKIKIQIRWLILLNIYISENYETFINI